MGLPNLLELTKLWSRNHDTEMSCCNSDSSFISPSTLEITIWIIGLLMFVDIIAIALVYLYIYMPYKRSNNNKLSPSENIRDSSEIEQKQKSLPSSTMKDVNTSVSSRQMDSSNEERNKSEGKDNIKPVVHTHDEIDNIIDDMIYLKEKLHGNNLIDKREIKQGKRRKIVNRKNNNNNNTT